jgi:4-hydroxy-tetrahydrodipicolinate synthase
MTSITIMTRNCTAFSPLTGELDEEAYAASLERFVETGIDVYAASGGSGEANALTHDELRRVYAVTVAVCKGKVAANANIPEVKTAREAIEFGSLAIEQGVDLVNMYGPASVHGFKPTELELRAYYETVLEALDAPIALAPNPIQGYKISAALIAELANRYGHVAGITLAGVRDDVYFCDLMDRLERDDLFVTIPIDAPLQQLFLGATGVISNHANIIPRTVRQYVDHLNAGRFEEAVETYALINRFHRFAKTTESLRGPRWEKTALRLLNLPGGAGGVRPPYLLPSDQDTQRFAAGLTKLGIPEIDELAHAAGLIEQPASVSS